MKENTKKIVYALATSGFIVGLVTTLSWSYTSRWFGLLILISSLFIMYVTYKKEHKSISEDHTIKFNLMGVSLGLLLIGIDISYNIIMKDAFNSFDHGMIIAGLVIVLLNSNLLKLKIFDDHMISFSTYFIFLTMVLYGFLFEGITILLGTTDSGSNVIWDWFNANTAQASAFVLNLIEPTTANGGIVTIDTFSVGIGYACSGIESISVFISAVAAYFMSKKNLNIRKNAKVMLLGVAALYLLNVLRVAIIILVGYYRGISEMMFVHANLGWIMFVLSMAIFWYFIFDE